MSTKSKASKKAPTKRAEKKPGESPSLEHLLTVPHSDWNSPANARLGEVMREMRATRDKLRAFFKDVPKFPTGMFPGIQDEILQRLRAALWVLNDQLMVIDSDRICTNEEWQKWRAGEGPYPSYH